MSLIRHFARTFSSHIMRMKGPYHWDFCWLIGLFSPDVTFGNCSRSSGRCDFAPTDVTWRGCLSHECCKESLTHQTNNAARCIPCLPRNHQLEEKLQPLFQKKCLSNQALGRWYDVCEGPFPARLLSLEVNLLNASTEAFLELLASGIASVLQPKMQMSLNCLAAYCICSIFDRVFAGAGVWRIFFYTNLYYMFCCSNPQSFHTPFCGQPYPSPTVCACLLDAFAGGFPVIGLPVTTVLCQAVRLWQAFS